MVEWKKTNIVFLINGNNYNIPCNLSMADENKLVIAIKEDTKGGARQLMELLLESGLR